MASISLGATVIEKHFTLSRAERGVDSAFSLEPDELSALVIESKRAWQSFGSITYGPTEVEQKGRFFRRSIFVAENISAGETFTTENLRIVRPGNGAPPSMYEAIIGNKTKFNLVKATPLSLDVPFG